MKVLNFETEEMKTYVRIDQDKTLEQIKYNARMKKDLKISKTEIIRLALDSLFKFKDFDEIIDEIEKLRQLG